MVTTVLLRPLAKQANDLPIFLTEELEFLSMAHTEISLLPLLWAHLVLPEPLHYVGYNPIRSQVTRVVGEPAHWAEALSFLGDHRLLVVCSDASFAEAVATLQAQGFCQEPQADGAGQLLLYVQQGS